jgi:hypothetical protein
MELSYRADLKEFYEFFKYTDDINLNLRLQEWERSLQIHRPHSVPNGLARYESLKKKMVLPHNLR